MKCLCWQPSCSGEKEDSLETCPCCLSPLLLHDRYQAQQVLGKNALSRTILAYDRQLNQRVIVKQWEVNQSTLDRGKLLQKVPPHPHIPTMKDWFVDGPLGYWVYPYIDGVSFAPPHLTTPLTESQVWQMLVGVLPLVHFLHEHHIIHGDIKPGNILWKDCHYYLIDLGLVTGDPAYTAPEQLQDNPTYASDIYSLGTIAIFLLWRVTPFQLQECWELSKGEIQDRHLRTLLDGMIAPSLLCRFPSVRAVIAQIQLHKAIKIPLPSYPIPSPWRLCGSSPPIETLQPSILALTLHPQGDLFVLSRENKILELRQWQYPSSIAVERNCSHAIKALTCNDTYVIGGDSQGTIHLWDWQELQPRQSFSHSKSGVRALDLSLDGKILAWGGKSIELWDTDRWERITSLPGQPLGVRSLAFSPNGKYLAVGMGDNQVVLWEWERGIPLYKLRGHTWAVLALAFDPTGQILASGGIDGSIRLWDLCRGVTTRVLSGHSWRITALHFSASGKELVSSSWDKTWKRWDVSGGCPIEVVEGCQDGITAQVWHRDSDRVICGCKDGGIYLWNWDPVLKSN